MENPTITFILNNKTYSFSASDIDAIRQVPGPDRRELIKLLEVVKSCEKMSQAAVQQAATSIRPAQPVPPSNLSTSAPLAQQSVQRERLSNSDADDLMARLIMEEKRNKKQPVTTTSFYKFVGLFAAAVVILILIL